MNINHEMSYSDKLKEIKRTTNATQKDLAMKLGVSSKTMSFWLNGKDIPSVRHEKTIQELYCKVVDAVKQKTDARKAVEEYDARHDDGAESLRKGISDAGYYEGKSYAISQEKGNTSKIYLYPAKGKAEDDWYRACGRSMVFYKTLVAPRLGRKAQVMPDPDEEHIIGGGVVAIKQGNRLMEDVIKIGYTAERVQFGVIIIDIKKDYTEKEIGQMRSVINDELNQVKNIIKPKETFPKLINAVNELLRVMPSKIRKLHESYRDIYAKELMEPLAEMVKIYFRMANGRMEKRDAKLELLRRADDVAGTIYMLDEGGLLSITARARMGENVVRIRSAVEELI